jgi:hypothetical protein
MSTVYMFENAKVITISITSGTRTDQADENVRE